MESDQKGLFGRLLDFWKERSGRNETDSIGFWHEQENMENHFAEMGTVAVLNQQETKKAFWEDTVTLEEKEKKSSVPEEERKTFLAVMENREEENAGDMTEGERAEKKNKIFFGAAEPFREEKGQEKMVIPFLWGMPAEEKENRKSIPVMPEPAKEKELVMEEPQEMPKNETSKREEMKAEPVVDIERLMRQMTKKLWEERESCGRRLR